MNHPHANNPLVSVVMPAHKALYLAQALESVAAQTHRPLELIVCDDSRGEQIRELVEAFADCADFPVHYSRNPERLWETRSTARGVALASGMYIKLLHDDDLLEPECVASLVSAIEQAPGIALASSRRRRIGARGRWLPDVASTRFPFAYDVRINGPELVSFLADCTVNFIGEPSTILCRRQDLLAFGERIAFLGSTRISWVADLALYAKLLQYGDLALLAAPLTSFRVSTQQFSQLGRNRPGIGDKGYADFRQAIHELGWYRHQASDLGQVALAPLDGSAPSARADLLQLLEQAADVAGRHHQAYEWQSRRAYLPALAAQVGTRAAKVTRPPRLGLVAMPARAKARDLERTLVRRFSPADMDQWISCKVLGQALPTPRAELMPAQTATWDSASPAASLNAAIEDWDVDWLLIVEAGTEFTLSGMTQLLLALADASPELRALYCDEWYRAADDTLTPVMRPDLNLDLLIGNPAMLAGHWVFRRKVVMDAGGFDAEAGSAAELELILRLLQQDGLGGITHLPEPLLTCTTPRLDAQTQQRVITTHLQARGYAKAAVEHLGSGLYRIDYGHQEQPPVSLVVIASADTTMARLERCVVSVLEQTRYPHYELLLIDNGASPELSRWIEQVETLAAARVRAFTLDPPIARSAACNVAASQANGEYIVFLRAEAAVIQPRWLEHLLNHAQRPEVGIVGAKAISAASTITHAGLVPGLLDSAGHAFAGQPMDAAGYMGRLRVAQNYSAVSDCCMMIRMEVLGALGGFDDQAFADAGADVDLCLRAAAHGALTVWTPEATLLHGGQGAPYPDAVRETLLQRWLPQLTHDPAYNRNLDLGGAGFALGHSELSWDPLPWRPLPRVLAVQSDTHGSGLYRITQPFDALRGAGMIDGARSTHLPDAVEIGRQDPDVLVVQRRPLASAVETMARLQRHSRAFKVLELDDYIFELPLKNVHRQDMPKDVEALMREALRHVDRFVVSTPKLAEALTGYHSDIRVVENRLDPAIWRKLPASQRRIGTKPRVGWAGGVSHTGDLEMIAEVVRKLAGEVTWVFFGLCPEPLRPYVDEILPGVEISRYPQLLASLNLDLALAPLERNLFNECKSNLRLLEYGACGYPVICSDLTPYRGTLPVTRVKNRTYDWLEAIRTQLADPQANAAAGDALRDAVRQNWMLEGQNLVSWRDAWLPD